jgi:hypothetical protein
MQAVLKLGRNVRSQLFSGGATGVVVFSLILSLAVSLCFVRTAEAFTVNQPHYPDLQTLPPFSFSIDTTSQEALALSAKLLRFSNAVVNLGHGPLELYPEHDTGARKTRVNQRIYTHGDSFDGSWEDVALIRSAGKSEFHPSHNHWHFTDFALYELRIVGLNVSVGSKVRGTGEKTTFCVTDTLVYQASTLEHLSLTGRYFTCGQMDTIGISVGWGDVYDASLPDQWIDITNVPNGTYWLVSTADPKNRLAETNDNNNSAQVKINITGNTVQVVQ